MIIMSNHNQMMEQSLADEYREISLLNAKEKISILIDRFKRELMIASRNGLRKIEFILMVKDHFNFINQPLIDEFKIYLDTNGFHLYDYTYVDEEDILSPFHYFVIGW